jgi:DNA-binding HxlR family transcriptional regulator
MARRESRRSVCPLACSLDILGDRWTILVLRDLFAGRSRYGEFAASPEKIATNILAERLERLRRHGLITATESLERTGSAVYALTPKGRDLRPVLEALRDWGLRHVKGTKAMIKLSRLHDVWLGEMKVRAESRAAARGEGGR